ncbi:MAG TPA: RDD family protein [Thermomicrobiaceae bacterium]|nr:RDD family protein [Thermomicrobiaceae bacterium]
MRSLEWNVARETWSVAAAPDRDVEPGGFWQRALGFLIDWLVVLPVALAALVIISGWYAGTAIQLQGWRGAILSDSAALPAYLAGGFVLGAFLLLYFSCFWVAGRSIGMAATGTRVVRVASGRPLSLGRAVVRALLASIVGAAFWGGLIAFIGQLNLGILIMGLSSAPYLWMLVDTRGQTLIDRLAGSAVQRTALAADRMPGRDPGAPTG